MICQTVKHRKKWLYGAVLCKKKATTDKRMDDATLETDKDELLR